MISVYTDGGAHNNGPNKGIGGWGAVIIKDGEELKRLSGGSDNTTSNRMELTALLASVKYLIESGLASEQIYYYSDSQYTQNTVTTWMYGWANRGWTTAEGSPVKNIDLVKELYELYPKLNVIHYTWLRGHAGHKWNEVCDDLATQEQKKLMGLEPVDRTKEILEADPTYRYLNAMTKQKIIEYVISKGFKIEEEQ